MMFKSCLNEIATAAQIVFIVLFLSCFMTSGDAKAASSAESVSTTFTCRGIAFSSCINSFNDKFNTRVIFKYAPNNNAINFDTLKKDKVEILKDILEAGGVNNFVLDANAESSDIKVYNIPSADSQESKENIEAQPNAALKIVAPNVNFNLDDKFEFPDGTKLSGRELQRNIEISEIVNIPKDEVLVEGNGSNKSVTYGDLLAIKNKEDDILREPHDIDFPDGTKFTAKDLEKQQEKINSVLSQEYDVEFPNGSVSSTKDLKKQQKDIDEILSKNTVIEFPDGSVREIVPPISK